MRRQTLWPRCQLWGAPWDCSLASPSSAWWRLFSLEPKFSSIFSSLNQFKYWCDINVIRHFSLLLQIFQAGVQHGLRSTWVENFIVNIRRAKNMYSLSTSVAGGLLSRLPPPAPVSVYCQLIRRTLPEISSQHFRCHSAKSYQVKMPVIKHYYFDFPFWRAEVSRLALILGDVRVEHSIFFYIRYVLFLVKSLASNNGQKVRNP